MCLDTAGATVGLMNTASQVGVLLGSLAYGYIVDRSGSFDAAFYSDRGAESSLSGLRSSIAKFKELPTSRKELDV